MTRASQTFRELLRDDAACAARWGVVECDLSGPTSAWFLRNVLARARARHPRLVARVEESAARAFEEARARAQGRA